MHRMWCAAAAESGRLLRVLLVRVGALSTNAGRTGRGDGCCFLLHGLSIMANGTVQASRDWLNRPRSNLLAWWIPHAAILAGLFVPTSIRIVIWTIALIWMGMACILNARRCGRTHCRYTGPYYLAMIAPVLVLGSGIVAAGIYGWIALGVVIVGGSKLIWLATERTWGKFS